MQNSVPAGAVKGKSSGASSAAVSATGFQGEVKASSVSMRKTTVLKGRRAGAGAYGYEIGSEKVERWRQKMLDEGVLSYVPKNFDAFVHVVKLAPPMQLLETERVGVNAAFLGDLAERMEISYSYLAETVGIPKATAARKLANNEKINGAAAIALARLLAMASEIVEDSTSPAAESFDTAKWLGQWIERPQPALGGRKPSELLDTPTGVAMVTKLLGAVRSGAYQ